MGAKLFQDSELIKAYNEGWKGSEKWGLVQATDTYALRLARALQVHHAGVTIIAGDVPIGSGVLVKGAKGHGILTAGHVCGAVQEAIEQQRLIAYVPQGTREPARPGERAPVLARLLPALRTLTGITLPRPRRAKQRKRGCALVELENLYRSLS